MKQLYRKKYLELRKNIKNKSLKDEIIFNKVIDNEKVNEAKTMLIYVSFNDEVDTIKLIKYFINKKKIAIPKIENDVMNFYYINSIDELKKGSFNVLEPFGTLKVTNFRNCVSITPGICYGKDGYRIGYGKGFYDRFYNKHKSIYKIGLCYHELLLDNIPHNKFDHKVDEIISD